MKLKSIKNGEHFIWKGFEYEKEYGGFVGSARNLTTGETVWFSEETNVEHVPKTKPFK